MTRSEFHDTAAPLPTIRRFPVYLRLLREMLSKGRQEVSARMIAGELGLESILVRKDFSFAGATGRPGIGFEIAPLIDQIETFLGWNDPARAFLIGVGRLGSALLGYKPLQLQGLEILAAFDRDPRIIGRSIANKPVLDIEKLPDLARRMRVHMAVLTVPAEDAQQAADLAVAGGICGIWNFAPRQLIVPEDVFVLQEDLSSSLAVLSVHVAKTLGDRTTKPNTGEIAIEESAGKHTGPTKD